MEMERETIRLSKSNEALMGLNDDVREIERMLTNTVRGTAEYDQMIVKIRDMALLYPGPWNGLLKLLGEDV